MDYFEGIVLQKFDSGDNNMVLHVISPAGKLSLIVRHAKRTQKSFGARLDLFDRGRFSVRARGNSMPILTSFESAGSFHCLRSDLDKFVLASSLAETVDLLVKEGLSGEEPVYDALSYGLQALEEASDMSGSLKASFLSLSHILALSGINDMESHERPSLLGYMHLIDRLESFVEKRTRTRSSVIEILDRFRRLAATGQREQ